MTKQSRIENLISKCLLLHDRKIDLSLDRINRLNKDLKIKSPYNTYLNYGLPPGPINNPGIESIKAALFPENTENLYFVARGDGYHTFSRTKNEHNKAKKEFQRIRRLARSQKAKKG